MKKPPTKVITKKIITLKGIKIEVRLLVVPICVHWDRDDDKCKFKERILIKARHFPPNIGSRQELLKEKIKKQKK